MTDQLRQAAQQALEALEGELWLMLDKPEDEQYRVKYAYLLTVITALRTALEQPPLPVQPERKLRRGDTLRCIETDELCTVWAKSTTGKTLIKWSANNFGNYTAEQIGELFWIEPREAETPPEWPLVKNILDEYGLDAIAFVAEFKAAQRPWVGLTEEDWGWVADRKGTSLDTFDQGAAWAQARLKERNK